MGGNKPKKQMIQGLKGGPGWVTCEQGVVLYATLSLALLCLAGSLGIIIFKKNLKAIK